MRKGIEYILPFVLLAFLYWGCEDTIGEPRPEVFQGYEYFPLEVGKFIDYQVDSIVFDDTQSGNSTDTISFFVRERIARVDEENGDSVYVIERLARPTMDDPWELKDVWSAELNETEAIRSEENQRFLRLSFPLDEGKTWNSTAYLDPNVDVPVGTEFIKVYSNWFAEVISLNTNGTVGDFDFNNNDLLTVYQANDTNKIEIRVMIEQYAKDIGLVYRNATILDSRCKRLGDLGPCENETWDEKAEKGFKLEQVIIGHN